MKQETLLMAIKNGIGLKFIPQEDGTVRFIAKNMKTEQQDTQMVPKEVIELGSQISGSVLDDTVKMLINKVK